MLNFWAIARENLVSLFRWLKNKGPVEKSKRVKIRDKENSSRLVINQLDVLDSGYYQCIVSNPAASVNTTSVLRVRYCVHGSLYSQLCPIVGVFSAFSPRIRPFLMINREATSVRAASAGSALSQIEIVFVVVSIRLAQLVFALFLYYFETEALVAKCHP